MSQALAGMAFLSIDGKSTRLAGEFTWKPSTNTNEALIGQDGYHGHKTKPTAGEISAKLRDSKDISATDIGNGVDVSVVVELINGKTIIGRNMVCESPPETDAEEGAMTVKWFSPAVTEA